MNGLIYSKKDLQILMTVTLSHFGLCSKGVQTILCLSKLAMHSKLKSESAFLMKDTEIVTHLLRMYGRNGMIKECENIFQISNSERITNENISILKASLNVYAMNGMSAKAMQLFEH